MLVRVLFWVLAAADVAATGLLLVLGLAAAGASHDSPLSVALFLLPVPLLAVAAAVWLFVRGKRLWQRALGFAIVAAPVLFVLGARPAAEVWLNQYRTADGGVAMFKAGAMREVEEAIARNDPAAVAAAAKRANLREAGRDGSNVLVVALRQMEKNGGSVDVLRCAGINRHEVGNERVLQERR